MTLAQFLAEVVGFVQDIASDFTVYIAAAVVISLGAWLFRRFVRAGR